MNSEDFEESTNNQLKFIITGKINRVIKVVFVANTTMLKC